ncbi:MAG TPA: preprotein translocase subunit Sec61beta [Candidatus Nanoarchaeia archaeon]|nr:preprotein translocase subunit Sec61beta [Candidatus Nanoarchaeia archaeon]
MAQDRIHLPSGMGGLTRYFDEYKSKITLKPGHIIIIAVIIILIIISLHIQGNALLGIG